MDLWGREETPFLLLQDFLMFHKDFSNQPFLQLFFLLTLLPSSEFGKPTDQLEEGWMRFIFEQ